MLVAPVVLTVLLVLSAVGWYFTRVGSAVETVLMGSTVVLFVALFITLPLVEVLG